MKWFLRRAALLTAAVALAVTAVGTAVAQVSKPLTVAVLTFSNSSGVGGALLGSSASAAVETQFISSSRYDVVKKETVTKTMSDLSLNYPLGKSGIQQLATALEADDMITGDVAKVVRDSKTGQVRVTMRVEMTDRSSGELINGAVVTGESGIRPDFAGSQDVLMDEAVNKAAFTAVRSMSERILPEGTIFATSAREGQIEALLNIGSNSGVRQGMEFIVLRNREQVGRLQITSVSPTDSTAAVISTTRGVQPEDKIRAIFRLENISSDMGGTGGSRASMRRSKLSVGNMAIGAAMLFGLTKLAHGSFSEGKGARNATAVATGPYNGAPYADSFPGVPLIHIKWSAPAGVKQSDILAYAVYRLDQIGHDRPVRILDRGQTSIYDDGYAWTISDSTSSSSSSSSSSTSFTGGKIYGLDAGAPTRYLIRTAYNKVVYDNTSDSTSTDTSSTSTEVAYAEEVITCSATGLVPPPTNTTTLPTDATALSSVVFHFQAVPGGDRYVIQIADNPNFTNAEQYPKGSEGMAIVAPPNTGPVVFWADVDSTTGVATPNEDGDTVVGIGDIRTDSALATIYCPAETMTVNLLTSRFDFTTGQYYWRVGVRSSKDDNRPENGGWVWGTMAVLGQTNSATSLKSATQRRPGSGSVRPAPANNTTPLPTTGGGLSRSGRGR